MPTTRQLTDPALAAVAAADEWARQAEVAKLVATLDWATTHEVSGMATEQAVSTAPGLQLGGPGCPWISEYDTWDLACILGLSAGSVTRYLGNALELRYRLRLLWQRVLDLDIPLWRAVRIAERTQYLPLEGAAQVDQALAPSAHTVVEAQIERAVASALAEHAPLEAEHRRKKAEEHQHLDIDLTGPHLLDGVAEIHGHLDLADALDLDAAIGATARQLADLGSTESLDVRRARAAGEIARAQAALDLTHTEPDPTAPTEPAGPTEPVAPTRGGRGVTLYAHLNATDVAFLDNTRSPVLVEQLLTWCQAMGTKVTIKPVIDLNANLSSDGYVPSTAVAEQVDLRDRRCVFPFCTRLRTDKDHRVPYDSGGQTESHNVARLCRGHHRAKTFSTWTYDIPAPGIYLWHSPAGNTLLVDRTREP